jgi:hypothetical protein
MFSGGFWASASALKLSVTGSAAAAHSVRWNE